MTENRPSISLDLFGEDIDQAIRQCQLSLNDLHSQAEHIKACYDAFTYDHGAGLKRPTSEWSHLSLQVHALTPGARVYAYWRNFKASIQRQGKTVRISKQLSLQRGRTSYRTSTLLRKAQPWEQEELIKAEQNMAVIRSQSLRLANIHSLLLQIQKAKRRAE